MQALAVVEHGNVFQDVLLGLKAALIVSPLHPLLFQATEETLNHRIVPAVPLTAHAALDVM